MAQVRWGIAGPGAIAERFVAAMPDVAGGRIVAVASRAAERAAAFASRHDIERAHGSYAALADDDGVDAVYVAVPHSAHEELAVRFLAAGKHVLCEKPMALNALQVQRMVTAARSHQRFLMEAIWSRFLPAYRVLCDLLAQGRIGEPALVDAEFGFRMPVMADHRLFDPALGGGAALDLGIYPLQLASLVLGAPEGASATGVVGTSGVDELVVATSSHPQGIGITKASLRVGLAGRATITGSEGAIELSPPMHDPRRVTVRAGGRGEVIDCDYTGDGLRFEIDEVHRCLDAGALESEVVPLDESVALARTLDAVRADLGVSYPGDA